MYKEILLTLDGSRLAEAAIPHACALAKAFDARVTIISVVEIVDAYPHPSMLGAPVGPLVDPDEERAKTRAYVDGIVDRMEAEGVRVDKVVREGDAASQICDFAREGDADLIVMSTHGLSGIKRWVYGSVADKVLHGAHVPVLLVRVEFDE